DCVAVNACGVDYYSGMQVVFFPAFTVPRNYSGDPPCGFFDRGYFQVVERHAALIFQSAGQAERQAGIIELPVVVDDAAAKTCRLDRREHLQGLVPAEVPRRSQAESPGQEVVELEAGPVERPFPPVVERDYEGEVMHQVRRVPHQQSPLMERL